jgi:hypothetical protein
MNAHDAVAKRVQQLRPHAKFIAIEHSSEFIDSAAELGDGFFTANLYDERIDANMITIKLGRVMIQNTYISSFAFNLFLCWLYHHRLPSRDPTGKGPPLDRLLHHNFKKFFAEQIYRQTNRVPSRALLLETLLFEQVLMVGVFAAKDADPQLSADADAGANLMSLALSLHELGHFYLATKPGMWDEIVQSDPTVLGPLYERVKAHYPADLAVEFQCDVHAVMGCLRQYESHAGPEFALRAIVFAYAAYAAMYSAAATAAATAALWDREPVEPIDFRDISPMPHVDYETEWAIDRPFLQRALLVAELCEKIAAGRDLSLYGDNVPFPLPPTIVEDLVKFVGRVFDCDDENARRMSNLVARALDGDDEGMEYLYLRSKVFRTNRAEPLKL